MKRVLQIVTRSDWAGAQKVLYFIVEGLLKNYPGRFEFEVACGPEDGRLIEKLKTLGVKVHVVNDFVREIDPLKDMRAYSKIKKLIKDGKYDIVHTHSSKAGFLGRIAAKGTGVEKVIHTVHGLWPIEQFRGFKRNLVIFLERIALRYSDVIVFLCKRDLEKARKLGIYDEKKVCIVKNAVPFLERPSVGRLRKILGIDEDFKIVGNVARLSQPKNPLRFLRVAKWVLKEFEKVVFVWIGGTPENSVYSKAIEKFFDENSYVKDRVFFIPFRENVLELLVDFDVFLMTSDEEGMPLSVLEALSLGVPVVSTDVGCLGEMEGVETARDDTELVLKVLEKLRSGNLIETQPAWNFERFLEGYVSIYDE